MNFLIVDDSKVIRVLVKKMVNKLVEGEHNIVEAKDGNDAVEKLNGFQPDLIMTDWNMPNMNGKELVIKVREMGITCKILVITSLSTEEIKKEIFDAGADFFFKKPVSEDRFTPTLKEVLESVK